MNNSRKYIPILICVLILGAGSFGLYTLHRYVFNFSERVVAVNTKLQELETSKKNIELFKKILSKGSKEQEQIDSYILSSKTVFKAITDLEKDAKKAGLFASDGTGIGSVTRRDEEGLKNLGAGEVIVEIVAEGKTLDVDSYIEALSQLPYVSHVEKVTLNFSENKARSKANITIVITELI